jgi:hypothetical protein
MAAELPTVQSASELAASKNGALWRLKTRPSLQEFSPPHVALGPDALYIADYFRREFPPREDSPWIAFFRNPVLYGRQFSIIDRERHVFTECFTRDRRWREGVPKGRAIPKEIPGTYLLAGAEFHNHYAHLFCDVLPRLMLFEEAGLWNEAPALLPPPSHAFAGEAWQKIGLAGPESKRWDDTCWKMDGLYFASPFKKFCSWTPESAAWIRQKFNPQIEQPRPPQKLFYISRHNGPRSMENEDEILAALQPFGFTVIRAEQLTLQQQIDLFSEAAVIIGPHGAGIQNALWAPRGCVVLELINARYFSGIYWTLSESLGHRYGFVSGRSDESENPLQAGYRCDPGLIRRALDLLLKSHSAN